MRTLHLTNPLMRGADVVRVQDVLKHHGYNVGVDGVFGPHTAAAVKRAKWDLGYPKDEILPVAGEKFVELLSGKRALPADYRVRKVERAHAHTIDGARQHVRDELVKWAKWGCTNEPAIHYEEVRPIPLKGLVPHVAPGLPLYTDCSGFVTLCYFLAGADDPNGNGYNGLGYTGTLLEHGRPVTLEQAKPGDLVIFGAFPGHHTAIIIENDGHDPLLVSHGQELGPFEISVSGEEPYQPVGVAYRSYLP